MGVWPLQHEADSVAAGPVAVLLARLNPALLRRLLRYGGIGAAISLSYSFAVIACMQAARPISLTMASIVGLFSAGRLSRARQGLLFKPPLRYFRPLRFAFSTIASWVVAVGGMYWTAEIAGRGHLLGIAWNWLIIPTMNFLTYMVGVFRAARGTWRAA